MLKPIKTVKPKTVGLGIRFARRITERAASVGSCELSESELVFAMGAARERDDLMSMLELLDRVLDLIKRGFDRRSAAIMIRVINNVGIMLKRGGFSREYSDTLEIYDKISAAALGKIENFELSEYRAKIHKTLTRLYAEQAKQTAGGMRGNTARIGHERALKLFKAVLERGAFTLNTLNSGLLQIMARNPELLKMLSPDKAFMELSLKNIENLRRRTERALSVQRFFDALTAEQIELLNRFIAGENLFSELREKSKEKPDLKYLLENSSEKSLSEFFGILKQRTEEQSVLLSERSYFDSAEEMKDFFVGAGRDEIERLIKELEKDRLYSGEARTLAEALQIYERETEKRRTADEKLTELFGIAESALKRRIGAENFSEERFIKALGTSRELKRFFADYAWENYRSDETLTRYDEYMKNAVLVSENKTFGSEQTVLRTDTDTISEGASGSGSSVHYDPKRPAVETDENNAVLGNGTVFGKGAVPDSGVISGGFTEKNGTAAPADGMTKESFADFLINSGELNLIFSESIKNSFLNASSDVAAAFAEYLVSTVREDSFAYYSGRIRELAEKAENILYCEGSTVEEKSAETFSLICGAWNESASQLSELYENFTQSSGGRSEILKLYSHLPKNDCTAVSEFLKAAAQGDIYFIGLSNDFLRQSDNILNKLGGSFGDTKQNTEYTFYDALNDMSENTLSLLLPLAGIRDANSNFVENANHLNTVVSGNIYDNISAADKTARSSAAAVGNAYGIDLGGAHESDAASDFAEYNTLAEQTSAIIVSAAFAEYLSSKVRGNGTAHYSGRIHTLAERIKDILYSERSDIRERSAEALALIYNECRSNSAQLSEVYESFTEHCSGGGDILRLYSRIPQNELAELTNIPSLAAHVGTNFFDLNGGLSKQLEKLIARMSEKSETELKSAVKEASADRRMVKERYQRLIFAEKANVLRAALPNELNVSSRFERRIFNIAKSGKSIVTDRKLYNALILFNGGAADNISDGMAGGVFSEIGYPALASREYFFTWEDGSVTLFNRAAANRTHIRTNGFFERHSAFALSLSERITEKFSAEKQRSDYNTAVELFYTDKYFESGGAADTPVNYAIPSAAASGGSDEISEKLGNIRGAIESINAKIDGIKRREEERSREFVTKSEQMIFERELKSSIERDIYLAGKRHGIY